MKVLGFFRRDRRRISAADLETAAWLVLEESSSDTAPHPAIEEWEALLLGAAEISPARRADLEDHLAACDRCLIEYRDLSDFLAPAPSERSNRSLAGAAMLLLAGAMALWMGIERYPIDTAVLSVTESAQLSTLLLYPAGPTRSADSRKLPDLEVAAGRKHYDLKLFLDKKRHGVLRVLVQRESESAAPRVWKSGALPVIESAELLLRIPAKVFDTEGAYLVEVREWNGGVIDVFPFHVVEAPR